MKKSIFYVVMVYHGLMYGQIPPTHFTAFNFEKKVAKVETVVYDFEDKVVIDNRMTTELFDDFGNITQTKTTYFDDNLVTQKNFVYQNGLLVETNESNSKRDDFTTLTTFDYTKNNRLSSIESNAQGFKSLYQIKYNQDQRIEQISGKFKKDHQIEKYFYTDAGKLWKKELTYSQGKEVASTFYELFIDSKIAVQYASNQPTITLYISSKNQCEIAELTVDSTADTSVFLDLCQLVFDANHSPKELSSALANRKDISVKSREFYKSNAHNDWIVNYSFATSNPHATQWCFRKITYADGTESGSVDFNIFTVNELKSMQK